MPKNLNPGTKLNDRYTIKKFIAKGGMGTTYQAIDDQTNHMVLLKAVSFSDLGGDWKTLDLFEREIETLKSLDHPNIPDYIDNFEFEYENETYYILIQEHVNGKSLQQVKEEGKKFNTHEIRQILLYLLDILDYIHSINPPVIHRDINPKNIILTEKNRVYLVDFGSAGAIAANTYMAGNTMVGTFGYMPQEQFVGKAVPSTDLYSLAMTMVVLLSGKEPSEFDYKDMKINYHPYVSVKKYILYCLDRMLEPDPKKRLESAGDAIDIIKRKITGEPKKIEIVKRRVVQHTATKKKKSNLVKVLALFPAFIPIIYFIFFFAFMRTCNKSHHQKKKDSPYYKFNTYVDIANYRNYELRRQFNYYIDWAGVEGPSSETTRRVYGLRKFTNLKYYMRYFKKLPSKPVYEKLDQAANVLKGTYQSIHDISEKVYDYYRHKYHLDDSFEKGKMYHPQILCKYKNYFKKMKAFRDQIRELKKKFTDKEVVIPESKNKRVVALFEKLMIIAYETTNNLFRPSEEKLNLDLLTQRIKSYEKILNELKKTDFKNIKNPHIRYYSYVLNSAKNFSTAIRDYNRDQKKEEPDQEVVSRYEYRRFMRNRHSARRQVISKYNGLVSSYNNRTLKHKYLQIPTQELKVSLNEIKCDQK